MSIEVPVDELATTIDERGPAAYLVTVQSARPHVVAVEVRWIDGRVVVAAGRRTGMNIAEHPEVTLLWPTTDAHPKHSLLVDGTAAPSTDGEWLVISPTSAILHRAGGRHRSYPGEAVPPVDPA